MSYAPIVLFVYNRPWHTKQTIEALKKNELSKYSELYIYSDGQKSETKDESVNNVRQYIKTINGFKSVNIIERDANWGLASSIIDGVTDILNKSGKIIVLEDDLITSPYFLTYMNDALLLYESNSNVASIHGYLYPTISVKQTFFMKGTDCWGWATWSRAWNELDTDGSKLLNKLTNSKLEKTFNFNNSYPYSQMLRNQIDKIVSSWAILWHTSMFLKNKYTLYPVQSLVSHIGMDDSGIHNSSSNQFNVTLATDYQKLGAVLVQETVSINKQFEVYFKSLKPNMINRLYRKIRQFLGGLND